MRFPLLFIALIGVLSGARAQEPKDTPLFLGAGVRVEHHPNDFPEYKLYAPETSEVCAPEDMGNSCGRVWWNSPQQPVLGKRYVTQMPAMIRLRGPGRDIWWLPFAHCMVDNEERKKRSASPPGVQCTTVLKRPEERMEWAIGGTAEGIDHAVPGTYTGIIPLTVTTHGNRWELDIPVTYTLHEMQDDCRIGFTRDGIPSEFKFSEDGVLKNSVHPVTYDITFDAWLCTRPGKGAVKEFRWEIRDLGPPGDQRGNPSFKVDFKPFDTGTGQSFEGRLEKSKSGTGYTWDCTPASSDRTPVTVTVEASGFQDLEPGIYKRNLRLMFSCL